MIPHTVFLPDEQATAQLGHAWATCFCAPMYIHLHGHLGAGKTAFVRGVLRGLGFDGPVKSPTYALVESYPVGQYTLNHFDLYRFHSPEEWLDAGLDELFNTPCLNMIEWPQHGGNYPPPADIIFEFSAHNNGRHCKISAHSAQGKRSVDLWQK